MPLDPQAQILLEQIAAMGGIDLLSLAQMRRGNDMMSMMTRNVEPVERSEDRILDGPGGPLPVRIYTPQGNGPFPVLVYFHGGGWVLGGLNMVDSICRSLTNRAQCIVISVDYRLAPEHKFPSAVEDAFAATQWASHNAHSFNGDPERLAVGGESAGGNLAAVVAQMARGQGGPSLIYQLLIYPTTDSSLSSSSNTPKMGLAYTLLNSEHGRMYLEHYLNKREEVYDPRVSPMLAPSLADLPPALVITAEYDPLCEQGQRYAERLQAAGVPVTHSHYDGVMHGFVNMASLLDKGKQALAESGAALYRAFYPL